MSLHVDMCKKKDFKMSNKFLSLHQYKLNITNRNIDDSVIVLFNAFYNTYYKISHYT